VTLQAQAPVAAAVAAPARPLVLVVDDEATTRLLSRATLEQAGFAVVDAFDGPGALEAYERLHPDLVLLDVEMPGISGYETVRRIRADARTSAIPVVAMTAHSDAGDVARLVAAGMDAHVAKPVEPRVLMAIVAERLASSR